MWESGRQRERESGKWGVHLLVIRAKRIEKDSVFQRVISASVVFIPNGYQSVTRDYEFI